MTKKLITIILGTIFLILLVGIIIPKVIIKNPDLSSSPCAEAVFKDASKFPDWLIRTPKVNSFTISAIDMSYYTLFGIKTNKGTGVSCSLQANNAGKAIEQWPITPPAGTGLLYEQIIDGKEHTFYNGVDLDPKSSFGEMSRQIVQDGHLAQLFLTHIGPPKFQIVYDGQIVPNTNFDSPNYPEIAISGDHVVYTDGGSTNSVIFYDGKKIGYGNNIHLSGDHYEYTTNVTGTGSPEPEFHIIYDGKDLGSCCNGRFGSATISGDHVVYTGILSKTEADLTYSSYLPKYISHVIIDGKDIGDIKATSWPEFSGSHMAYVKSNGDLIYDNKKIADKVNDVKLSGDNILYVTESSDVYYNGKKVGQGTYIQLDGGDYVYLKMIKNFSQSEEPLCNIIFNGADLGQSTECRVSLYKDNTLFQRVVNGSTHMILNGRDIGEGEGAQLIEPLKMQVFG